MLTVYDVSVGYKRVTAEYGKENIRILGDRLRARREYLGLTQQDVADRLHMNRVTYTQYETGRNEMAVSDLPRLAEVLRVSVGYFFGEDKEEDVVRDDAITYFNGLPPAMKTVARAQLKALHDAQDAEDDAVGRVGEKAE